eukprot:Colp12_sorted_trinity150504_noHs@11841
MSPSPDALVMTGFATGLSLVLLYMIWEKTNAQVEENTAKNSSKKVASQKTVSPLETLVGTIAHVFHSPSRSHEPAVEIQTNENDEEKEKDAKMLAYAIMHTTRLNSHPQAGERNEGVLNLLHAIAEDQTKKDGYVHRGITCNICRTSPIRGLRYKCANCADYDLCEICETRDEHNRLHVLLKIRIPIPSLANPRTTLLQVFYPGKPGPVEDLTWDTVHRLHKETQFEPSEITALFDQFCSLSAPRGPGRELGIDKEAFDHCLGPLGAERNLATERIFRFFDQDNNGIIDFPELVRGLSVLSKGSQQDKLEYAFRGYDIDGSGYITREELHKMRECVHTHTHTHTHKNKWSNQKKKCTRADRQIRTYTNTHSQTHTHKHTLTNT